MDINNEYGCLERQKECLELLKAFDDFCLQKNIIYSLDSGSLLGAIRHRGFIPWDDDIDIIVDRSTYQRLFDELNSSDKFCCFTELWFTRIQFVSEVNRSYSQAATIDVFVLDKAPNNYLCRKIKRLYIALLQSMFKERPQSFSLNLSWFRLWVGNQIGRHWSYEAKLKLYNKVSGNCNNSNSKFASCYNYLYKDLHAIYDYNILQHIHRCRFEDIEVNIIDGFDKFLTELYGDYMTPPKKCDRIPQHSKKS